jgi:hypothetical protein
MANYPRLGLNKKGRPTIDDVLDTSDPHLGFDLLKSGRIRLVPGQAGSDPQSLYLKEAGRWRTVSQAAFPISIKVGPVRNNRSRSAAAYTWEGPASITDAWLAAQGYPVDDTDVIIKDRYFRSLDSMIPAVDVKTSRRIIFMGCNFQSWSNVSGGVNGACIRALYANQAIRVYNSLFFGGGNPMLLKAGAGKAVIAQGCREVIIEHNEMFDTGGIQIQGFTGIKTGLVPTIQIKYNKFDGLDGRLSDPTNVLSGYYKEGNTWGSSTSDFTVCNLVQFNTVQNVPNIEIAYNEVICRTNASRFEDMVSYYLSSGTAASPIWTHHNLFRGGYVFDRWFNPATSIWHGNNMPVGTPGRVDSRGYQHSGGGGLLGDGKGATYKEDSGFILFENNLVLDMANYGIGISAGHDLTLRKNKVFRSGYLHDVERDVKIAWGHRPVQIQEYSTRKLPDGTDYQYTAADWAAGVGGLMDDGTGTGTKRVRWYNNDVYDNTFGYIYFTQGGAVSKPSILVNSPLRRSDNNVNLIENLTDSDALALISRQFVDSQVAQFRADWDNNGILVGLE